MDRAWPCILCWLGCGRLVPGTLILRGKGARMSGRGLIPCFIYIIFIVIIIIIIIFFFFIRSMDFPVIEENTGLRLSAERGRCP